MQGASVLGSLVLGAPILRACMMGMSMLGRCVGPVGTAGTTMLSLFCFPCVTHILPDTGVLGAKLSPWPAVPCQQASVPGGSLGLPKSLPLLKLGPSQLLPVLQLWKGRGGGGGGGRRWSPRSCSTPRGTRSMQCPISPAFLCGGHCSWALGSQSWVGFSPLARATWMRVGTPTSLGCWADVIPVGDKGQDSGRWCPCYVPHEGEGGEVIKGEPGSGRSVLLTFHTGLWQGHL